MAKNLTLEEALDKKVKKMKENHEYFKKLHNENQNNKKVEHNDEK